MLIRREPHFPPKIRRFYDCARKKLGTTDFFQLRERDKDRGEVVKNRWIEEERERGREILL